MKKNKLKKLIREVINEYNAPKKASDDTQLFYNKFNPEISNKLKKLIKNLLNYPESLSLEVDDNNIRISVETLSKTKSNSSGLACSSGLALNPYALKSSDDDLVINITKRGFILRYKYENQSRYFDDSIYNEIIDDVRSKVYEINQIQFDNIWGKINKESGILRDSNLDDLLG
jgi:hypothetical protein